ncbi:triacylglycerol lipase [Microdochium nivale]|nr:triacylglycerol lipase [Microdochium nivale]
MQPHAILLLCSRLAQAAAIIYPQYELDLTQRDPQLEQTVAGGIKGVLGQLTTAVSAGNAQGVITQLQNLAPEQRPGSIEEVMAALQAVTSARPATIIEYNAQLIARGILSGTVQDLLDFANGAVSAEGSSNNVNPVPSRSVYPKAKSCDAPYRVSEEKLRAAIHIPSTFTFGRKRPVILVPGTGNTGYITFSGNFIPLLTGVGWADPVWLNVPGLLLDDAQVNAEYVAYAINYIAAVTSRSDLGIIAWSQGNLDSQWAYKYWPSTRGVVTDHVAISADYAGTVVANAASLLVPLLTNDPSVLQQEAGSKFVTLLRQGGGDSAYVPTTSLYSGFFDEIVQPQSGTGASAFLRGATNVEVQQACGGKGLAGTIYTHESMLANPLVFAMAKDALTHDGPGQLSRVEGGLDAVCKPYLAPGLGLDDLLLTENAILVAGLTLVLYPNKVATEPPLKSYATVQSARVCDRKAVLS